MNWDGQGRVFLGMAVAYGYITYTQQTPSYRLMAIFIGLAVACLIMAAWKESA